MSREVSEALVLRGVDFSETSRILTLLTPARGLVACIAKGVRRKNSALAPVLDSLNLVEAVYLWKEGRQVQTLTEATLLEGFPGIKGDLERSAYVSFPLELAAKVARENDPSEMLFKTLLAGLRSLEHWQGNVPLHVLWQALQLLEAAGYAPSLDRCCHCGEALAPAAGFDFGGGATCAHCRADRRLNPARWDALKRLADRSGPPAIEYNAELFQLIHHYAARHLEADFRSVRVLHELFPHS